MPQLETKLDEGERVVDVESVHDADNPLVIFKLEDKEGDLHEVVVQIIQRPDSIVKWVKFTEHKREAALFLRPPLFYVLRSNIVLNIY